MTYPQTELGGDPARYAPTVSTSKNRGTTTFSEPLVMFGYLAAVTQTVDLVTGVIILPQRQTVPVAKQAA